MFKTQYAKVVDSTYFSCPEKNKMIGNIWEVTTIYYTDKAISLYNKDKKYNWTFSFSDVLPATEEEYKAQFEKKEIEEIEVYKPSPIGPNYTYFDTKELEIKNTQEKVNELVRAVNKEK